MLYKIAELTVQLRSGRLNLVVTVVCLILALAMGVLSTQRAGIAVASMGIVLLLVLAMTRPLVFSSIAVFTIFISRFAFDVGGFRLRAEMAIGLVCCVALMLKPRLEKFRYNGAVFVILGCWIAWLCLITVLNAPSFASSLTVLVWLALNLVTCLYIASYLSSVQKIVAVGVRSAFVLSITAVVLWVLATTTPIALYVQWDPTYGGYAAFATVFEANILASLVTLWAVVAMSNRLCARCGNISRVGLISLTPVVAIATHTRIALVASLVVIAASFVLYSRSRPYLVGALAVLAVCVYFGDFDLDQIGLSKFTSPFNLDEGTGRYRAATWDQAFADVQSGGWYSTFSGLGANSFGQRHLDPSLPGSGARWYLGNLPLQLYYDGGIVAVLLVVAALVKGFPVRRWILASVFLVVYTMFAISTSTLWLMQSWIFLAIALVDSRQQCGGDGCDSEDTEPDCVNRSS